MASSNTASLFACCCKVGSISSGEKDLDKIERFGNYLGVIFQIKDDLLDITGNVEGLGKPAGFDLKKNILTLPLIHIFGKLDPAKRKEVKRKLNNHVRKSELVEIRKLIEQHGGIQFAEKQIDRLSAEARNKLDIFPDSIYKTSLLNALDFNIIRKNS